MGNKKGNQKNEQENTDWESRHLGGGNVRSGGDAVVGSNHQPRCG